MKNRKTILLLSLVTIGLILTYYFLPEKKLIAGQKADRIVINKTKHELLLFNKEKLIAKYKISLSRNGLGKKTKSGDNLTPEGRFVGKKRIQTKYHRAIEVGEWGNCCDVLIHGLGRTYEILGKFQRWKDWTKGCVALTNDEIEEIYAAVRNGVLIEINK